MRALEKGQIIQSLTICTGQFNFPELKILAVQNISWAGKTVQKVQVTDGIKKSWIMDSSILKMTND